MGSPNQPNQQDLSSAFGSIISQLGAKQNIWSNYIALNGRLEYGRELKSAVRAAMLSFCLATNKNCKSIGYLIKTENHNVESCIKILTELYPPPVVHFNSIYPFALFVNEHSGVVMYEFGGYVNLDLFGIDQEKYNQFDKYLRDSFGIKDEK